MKRKIAEKIRQARVRLNLSQENIAVELGISVGAYSNIERGKSEVTVSRLYAIARILKVQVTDLLILKTELILEKQSYPLLADRSLLQINEIAEQLNDLKKEVAGIKNSRSKISRKK